jgi:hypothetical protein
MKWIHTVVNFHFFDNNDVVYLFMLFGHFYIFTEEMSIQILWPFFNGLLAFSLLHCKSSLKSDETVPNLQMISKQLFLLWDYLLAYLIIQSIKNLICMNSNWPIFPFLLMLLVSYPRNIIQGRKYFFVPSKGFIVLIFVFRCLTDFRPNFYIWYNVSIQLHPFSTPFVEKIFIKLSWKPCQNSTDHKSKSLFLDFQFYSIDLYVCSANICQYCLILVYSGFCNQNHESSSFVFLFQYCMNYTGYFEFWYRFYLCQLRSLSAGVKNNPEWF